LHPSVQARIAVIRRELKTESKNNLVRAVIGFILKESNLVQQLKKLEDEIDAMKAESKITDGFIDQNEAAFQSYSDSLKTEDKVS
jgi:molybdopterin-biosynthesis enzyme MoeA-like protein